MTKKPKIGYEGFGEILSVEVAYLQAARLLDVAASVAIKLDDTERMQNVALSWMELGKLLISGGAEMEDDDEDEEEVPTYVGFHNTKPENMEIVSE